MVRLFLIYHLDCCCINFINLEIFRGAKFKQHYMFTKTFCIHKLGVKALNPMNWLILLYIILFKSNYKN